ncbi:hypothetical protein FH972_021529 [Carpinus fangiana]|uniref:Signal recognition particle receptor subunit alpha homolog n=1 Tax=Carpinus fangiana TaxID=176857 RepID=A0A5N6KRR7_9ROSI|nr:hypothetical protein FH972_021529 [Carpinus fangiana]
MLDSFEIVSSSGVVLWSKSFAPTSTSVVNSLIRDVFIEEKIPHAAAAARNDASAAHNPPYKKEKYTVKWTQAKDLGLVFVLLDNIKTIFIALYREQFKKPHTSVIDCSTFDAYFDRQIQELEKTSAGPAAAATAASLDSSDNAELTPTSSTGEDAELAPPVPGLRPSSAPRPAEAYDTTSAEATPVLTPSSSRPSTPNTHLLTAKSGPGGKTSRRAKKLANSSNSASRDVSASSRAAPSKSAPKKGRKWGDDGLIDDSDDVVLNYSKPANDDDETAEGPAVEAIAQESFSKKTAKGEVVLKDLDEEMQNILASASAASATSASTSSGGIVNTGIGAISGLFRNVVGGKTLTAEDLAKPLHGMEEHLIRKNVARDAAVQLTQAVERDLVGTKTSSFESIDASIRRATEAALAKILTPTSSLDLLRSIAARRPDRPYVVSVVGVNGVGKSTTLAKLAFLLLHNNLRVLVAAADTFRSGAVEQLRVHVRNLQQLTQREQLGRIDLFERGYGRDAAHIARDAVAFAATPETPGGTLPYDVVLIDTAGRRHNDARLMASLEPFARLAQPDRILMVGEALVGTDSVAQARHFNEAFGAGRRLDGFIVSKCDTVGEMVGTLVSLVFATGVPIVAVGVGQHYGDLRGFNVRWARDLLLS